MAVVGGTLVVIESCIVKKSGSEVKAMAICDRTFAAAYTLHSLAAVASLSHRNKPATRGGPPKRLADNPFTKHRNGFSLEQRRPVGNTILPMLPTSAIRTIGIGINTRPMKSDAKQH